MSEKKVDVLDELMGYDPKNLSVFDEPTSSSQENLNVYRTRPKDSKSEDGIYRSRIRVLYNPYDLRNSIVKVVNYSIRDEHGFKIVPSALSVNDKSCPIFKAFSNMWWSSVDQEAKREFIKTEKVFDKSESNYVLIQVLEDANQPELEGHFMFYKLPRTILEKMNAKMKPSAESKKTPIPMMDFLRGRALDLEVQPGPDDPKQPSRKTREISYDLSEFDMETGVCPIIGVDKEQLFTDEELETITTYDKYYTKIMKTPATAVEQLAQLAANPITQKMRALMGKAVTYIKENVGNVAEEMGYKEWDEETTLRVNNYLDRVTAMNKPLSNMANVDSQAGVAASFEHASMNDNGQMIDPLFPTQSSGDEEGDDLPF